MTVDPPRRLRPRAPQRRNTVDKTKGAPSAKGSTAAARPVVTSHRSQILGPAASKPSRDRLTMSWSTNDIVSDQGPIASWGGYGSAFDQSGASVQLSDPTTDDGRIYLFGEGLYCVTVQLTARTSESASNDQAVAAVAQVWDRPDTESFACVVRGGDPHLSDTGVRAVSTTFYSQGRGLAGGGIRFFVHCNGATVSADVGQVIVLAIVQKIAGFGF